MLIRKLNLLNVALVAMCFFFATKIYRLWSTEHRPILQLSQQEGKTKEVGMILQKEDPKKEESNAQTELQMVDFILDHDLFQGDRKRPLAYPANVPPPPVLNVALHGIFQDDNGGRVLIQDLSMASSKPRWLGLGESIGEFSLTKIEEDQVQLEARGIKKVLVVFNNARPKIAVTPTPRPSGARPPAQASISPAQVESQQSSISQRELLLNRLREARQVQESAQTVETRQPPIPQREPLTSRPRRVIGEQFLPTTPQRGGVVTQTPSQTETPGAPQ
jgi:hypothetical protein